MVDWGHEEPRANVEPVHVRCDRHMDKGCYNSNKVYLAPTTQLRML